MDENDRRHGTYAGYQQDCRCQACRQAATEYTRAWRARHRGSLSPDDKRHGTTTGHNDYGCRCTRCIAAQYRALGNYYLRRAERLERKEAHVG